MRQKVLKKVLFADFFAQYVFFGALSFEIREKYLERKRKFLFFVSL